MRTKFLPLLLLLAALMPRAALAQKTHIASTSSSTTMTWDEFANNVTEGILYNNMTVYLDEDITVTTCAGDPWDRSFRGTFDGQGHTLTFNGDATYSWYAPFTSADGATFKNLKVTGTINSSNDHDFCAGFVGSIHTNNTCTFINCESNISINTDRYFHGGFVGKIQGGTTYFYGCTFTGRMFTFDDSSACSGFVGYCESSNYTAKVFFYDCIFDPSDINFSSQCFTFVRGNEANTYFSNCYYTRTYDWAEQGKQAYTITASSPITVALNGTATNYNVSHITAYSDNNGLVYNNTLLAGSGDQVSLNLYNSSAPYSVNYGTLSGTANPYTLTMEANNTVIALDTYVCHEDFEHDCDWTLVNGDLTNQWYWGEAAHNGEGTHGLYISNDSGTSNAYTATNPSMVYVYKTFTYETDVYKFSYDWLANGESTYDYLRVALVPASVTLTASTDIPSDFDVAILPEGWIALDGGSKLNQVTNWQTMSQELNITAGTYKMVFAWRNDNSVGNNPPAAIDNVSIERVPYPRPDNLRCTSFGATTATLAWTENGEATAWQICLNDDETNLINVTENPYTLTNLTAGTTYTVKVRATSSNGQSYWSNSISFNTTQIPAGIPYSTNFETDCDWIFINGSLTNQWVWGTAASHGEGTHGLYISNDGGTTNDYDKISSTMVYASKLFAFEPGIYKFSYDWLANGENNFDYLRVALVPANVFLEAGTTAPTVPSGSFYSDLPTGWRALDGGTQLKLSTEWQTMNAEVELPTAGNYMMVFAWRNDSSGGTNPPAAIDNVSIDAITCPMPNNMRCTAFNAHTATLAWTENGEASAWQICLNDDETNLIDVTENPYTLTNLTSETSYSVKVRANCGDKQSSWSNSANFTTTEACPTPTDFAATEIYGYGATLSWTGTSQSYSVMYRTAAHMDGHNERFDGTNIPSGWENKFGLLSNVMEGTALTTGSQWNFGTSNGVFNEHARINIYGNNPCCGWLVTPQIQLPEGAVLNFDLALTAFSGTLVDPTTDGVDDKFVVLISTDDEATWTILRQWDNAEGSTYVYNDINSTATGEQVSIDLASYAGQWVRIAFYGESTVSNADNNLHIDNVGIGIPIAAGVWKTVTVDEASAILTDLIPETLYEAKLQGNCGDDGLSLETSLSFSTIVACPGPTNLTAVDSLLAATTAGLSWHDSPDVDNYTVKYRTTSALFFEDFEGGIMPSDWTQSGPGTWDVTEGYGHNNIGTHSGTYNAIINHTTKEYETFLITPMLDLSGQNDLSLTFWYINYNWGSSDIDQLYVYYRVNEGEWIELWNTTEDHQVWTESGAITLPNPSANYQIGFKMIDKYGHGVGIDDIIIGTDVPAGEWQTASVPGGTAQVSTTLTSLSPETIYEAYVYPDCDPDMVSETVYFKTAQAPDNLFYWTDFETDGDWTFINSDYNKWFWGTAASDNDNHTLYISWTSNGSSYTYFGMSCMVYATKTFEFEEGAYNFSFDWKANGITKSAFLRAALVPSTVTLESTESALPGFNFYSLPSGWIAIDGSWQLNQSTEWQTSSNEVMVPSGTYMLAFIWFNNYLNENNPPAAVDNLVITRVAYPKPSDMQCTTLTPTTATLDWTENGTATAWQICINDNEDNLINVTQNSYTLSNLITETVYSAKVRAQYDTNYSDWSNTVVFTPTDKTVIGSGNTNAYYLPVSKEDSYGLTQQIYTASEIDGAGPIESIAFFKNDTIECNRNVEIYLRHTDKTTFENEYDWINIPGNPNFNGTVDFVDYGWTTINLSNPFVYDGTSNLVVVVYDKTNSGSSNDIVHFLSYEAPGQAIRSNYYNAIYGIHNLDISSNQRPFVEKVKNHIRFDKLNCARPSNIYVSKILHTSAYVYWTGESDSYTVIYTDLTNDETHTITTTTNSVTLTDLTIATQYELIVIPSCDENAVSNTITFTTKTNDFKVFVTDGDWDDPNNWEPMGVPTFDQVTAINANVTINRVVEINDISLINGSITIEDGGQLKYNTNSMTGQITVTMKKNITGYGTGEGKYYLLAWPFTNETSPSNVTNMLDDGSEDHEYDLYSWLRNPSDSLEWRNYKQTPFNLSRTNGYLYASKNSVELSFTGTLHLGAPYHVGFPPYDNSCRFGSWTVYGNPFLGDVYLTTSTSGGSSLPYYRLNEGGDALMAVASGPIAPLEGIFYKSSSNGPVFITKSTPTSRGSFLNINLSQGNSLKSNTIVRFDGGETLDKFMLREDGSKLSIPQDGKDYAVVSADHEGELPLSFKAETDGTYTLSFSCEEVEFSYLHLIDNLTGEDIDLMVTKPVEVPACYTFDARTTDNENRFKLVFITK